MAVGVSLTVSTEKKSVKSRKAAIEEQVKTWRDSGGPWVIKMPAVTTLMMEAFIKPPVPVCFIQPLLRCRDLEGARATEAHITPKSKALVAA